MFSKEYQTSHHSLHIIGDFDWGYGTFPFSQETSGVLQLSWPTNHITPLVLPVAHR